MVDPTKDQNSAIKLGTSYMTNEGGARISMVCASMSLVRAWLTIGRSSLVRCRACSTAERTATNIVLAPIARAHRAAPAPAPHAHAPCSSCSCSPLLTLMLPAPHARAPCSSLTLPALPAPAPCSSRSCSLRSRCLLSHCSLRSLLPFRLWHCSRTFPSTTCARYSVFRLCFSALSLAPWTIPFLV